MRFHDGNKPVKKFFPNALNFDYRKSPFLILHRILSEQFQIADSEIEF